MNSSKQNKKNLRSKSNYPPNTIKAAHYTTDFRNKVNLRESILDANMANMNLNPSIYKLKEIIQQNDRQSVRKSKSKKRKQAKAERQTAYNIKALKSRSRLDQVNQTYNGELTPNNFFCTEFKVEESQAVCNLVEEQLRRRIRELETCRNHSNERGTISDATTATVNLDEK